MPGLDGQDGGDGWHTLRGGFRVDSKLSAGDDLTLSGALFSSRAGDFSGSVGSVASPMVQTVFAETNTTGGYAQAVWTHRQSERSDTTLQISFDRYRRNDALRETRNTVDADFEHHFRWGERQDIVWGLGYRYSASNTDGDLLFSLFPADLNTQLFSAYVQDEFTLVPDRLSVTVGTKVEHNYYTGFGIMPTVRGAWSLTQRQTLWAAVSRALSTPSSTDTASELTVDGFVPPGGPPVLIRIVGNPAFQNEREIAYEAGYRSQLSESLSLDFAGYFNSYHDLQTTEPEPPFFETTPPPPHIVMPLEYENLMHGETHGVETFATWRVTDRWTLTPAYAFEDVQMQLDPTSQDTATVGAVEGSSPRQWARVDSHLVLPQRLSWDASANFVGRLSNPSVASYTRVDTQLTWNMKEHFSASLVGQNLLRNEHVEFLNEMGTGFSNFIKRSAYAKLTWRF
jgi:iron complex outermembrane recepter protein